MLKWLICLVCIALLGCATQETAQTREAAAPQPLPSEPVAGAYYVDAQLGDDANSGTAPNLAWKTLEKVNGHTFQPGEHLLFRAGRTWMGQLRLKGSGSAGNPIRIDKYGDGPLPIINQGDAHGAVVAIYEQDQWEIRHLEVVGGTAYPNEARQGIVVTARESGRIMKHIVIAECVIRDIWGSPKPYDGSAIYVGVPGWGDAAGTKVSFEDVLIENNVISGADRCGILVWTCAGPHFAQVIKERNFTHRWEDMIYSRNVVVRGNRLENLGGDAILIMGSLGALVERNIVKRSCLKTGDPALGQGYNPASAAIWLHSCSRSVMQYNEVYETGKQPWNGDGMAFDFDFACYDNVLQYNYSKDNVGGFLLIMNGVQRNVTRFNISQNDGAPFIHIHNSPENNNDIYNNVFYVDNKTIPLNANSRMMNNIFYATGAGKFKLVSPRRSGNFEGNCFFGPWEGELPPDDCKVLADPKFVNPGQGGVGLDSVDGYKLQPDSPCRGAGVTIGNEGGKDYWGQPTKINRPNIGADDSQ